jgi:hypothetical protein
MLYRSTHCRRRAGAPMKNLAHSASFHSGEKSAPSNPGTKHLAYNLANFCRTLALPDEVERWSLTTLREKVVKIGAKEITHARYTTSQMAEIAVPRELFRRMLDLIDDLRPRPMARC